jgi:hypothetical protein
MSKGGGVNIPSDYTIKLESDGSTFHIDSELDNIHLKEIAPITVNSNIAVTQPIVTQSTSKSDSDAKLDLKVEPLDSTVTVKPLDLKIEPLSVTLDVKPLVIDSCQTVKLAPLPPIRMEQPYSQHFGITFMGIELFGINISGKSETRLHSPPKQRHYTEEITAPCEESEPIQNPKPAFGHRPSGLRIRVK